MGAASSASVAATVESYSESELVEVVGGLPSDCRAALQSSLRALVEEKAAREAQPTATDMPPKEVLPPREEAEPLEAPTDVEKQAPPSEALPPRKEAQPLESPVPTQKAARSAEELPPRSEAKPEEMVKSAEEPGGKVPSELSQAQADFLHDQLEALADPSTGGIRVSTLGALFEELGTKLADGELKVLLEASSSQGKTPTPGQFLDFILEGTPVV